MNLVLLVVFCSFLFPPFSDKTKSSTIFESEVANGENVRRERISEWIERDAGSIHLDVAGSQ